MPFGFGMFGGAGGGGSLSDYLVLHNAFQESDAPGGLFNAEVGDFDFEYREALTRPSVFTFLEGSGQYLRTPVAHTFLNGAYSAAFSFWVKFDADHPTGLRKIVAFGTTNNYIATDGNSLVAKFTFGTGTATATKTNWVKRDGTWQHVFVVVIANDLEASQCTVGIYSDASETTPIAGGLSDQAGVITVSSSTMTLGGTSEAATQCYGQIGMFYMQVGVVVDGTYTNAGGYLGDVYAGEYLKKCRPAVVTYLDTDDGNKTKPLPSFMMLADYSEHVDGTTDYPVVSVYNRHFNVNASLPFTEDTLQHNATALTNGGEFTVEYGSVVGGLHITAANTHTLTETAIAGVSIPNCLVVGIRYRVTGTFTQGGAAQAKIGTSATVAGSISSTGAFDVTFVSDGTTLYIGVTGSDSEGTAVDVKFEDVVITPNYMTTQVGTSTAATAGAAETDFADAIIDGLQVENYGEYPASGNYYFDISRPITVLESVVVDSPGSDTSDLFMIGELADPGISIRMYPDTGGEKIYNIVGSIRGTGWSMTLSGAVTATLGMNLKIGVTFNPVAGTAALVVNGVELDTSPVVSGTPVQEFVSSIPHIGKDSSDFNALWTVLETKVVLSGVSSGALIGHVSNLRGA
jgi:hypothetical protein